MTGTRRCRLLATAGLAVVFSLIATGGTVSAAPATGGDLHSRLLTLDTHFDTPVHFARAGWRFGDRHRLATDLAQVDLPRMADGNLDGGFFVIFTPQGPLTAAGYAAARAFAFKRSGEIDATIAAYPERILPARRAADAVRLDASHQLIAFKSIENSYPLGEDLGLLGKFYDQGVRLAGPVHSLGNQFADSATDTPRWGGLSAGSALGRRDEPARHRHRCQLCVRCRL